MTSFVSDSVQGFLNRTSTLHSVECRRKNGVTPASSSNHFSIGVTSTATVGPKLDWLSVRLRLAAPPISSTAAGSFSTDWPNNGSEQQDKNDMRNTSAYVFTLLSWLRISPRTKSCYARRSILIVSQPSLSRGYQFPSLSPSLSALAPPTGYFMA